eukprot:606250-Prymnesium_polylepis.1
MHPSAVTARPPAQPSARTATCPAFTRRPRARASSSPPPTAGGGASVHHMLWGSVWGITGMVLAVPMTAVARIYLAGLNHPLPRYFASVLAGTPTEAAASDEGKESGTELAEMPVDDHVMRARACELLRPRHCVSKLTT